MSKGVPSGICPANWIDCQTIYHPVFEDLSFVDLGGFHDWRDVHFLPISGSEVMRRMMPIFHREAGDPNFDFFVRRDSMEFL